jgi:hypothetical protein
VGVLIVLARTRASTDQPTISEVWRTGVMVV